MPAPYLSIVIPAHDEEGRLPETLAQVLAFIESQPFQSEVLVVENGSLDRTLQVAQSYAAQHPHIRVLRNRESGKGLAVRRGMLEARGEYRFMCDADLSMPIEQVKRFLPPALTDFEVAIASREGPGAVRYNEPAYRHLVGRGYNALIRLLAVPGLNDTQCGFKCFRGEVVRDLFCRQTLTGWAFDVELLLIARKRGYRIVELPVPWHFNPESKIRVLHDALDMGLDLIKIRLNGWRGLYDEAL